MKGQRNQPLPKWDILLRHQYTNFENIHYVISAWFY